MDGFVLIESVLSWESLVAHIASEWPLVVVAEHVALEVPRGCKLPAALSAGMSAFLIVGAERQCERDVKLHESGIVHRQLYTN